MGSRDHPKQKGQCSEAAVLYEFVKRNIPVLEPFGDNERYDFVIDLEGDFHRIQVKTARFEDGRLQFETRSSGTLTRTVKKESYIGDIDAFLVHAPAIQQTYAVPIDLAPETSMGLRVDPPLKDSPNINWASDFEIDDWVAQLRTE